MSKYPMYITRRGEFRSVLNKCISPTGKQFINFQGVWDGFNCCFSKSLGKWTAFAFSAKLKLSSPRSQAWGVGKVMTSWVGREILGFAHHFGPWDTGRRNREKLVFAQKVLSEGFHLSFCSLSLLQNKHFPCSCKHSYSRVWLLPFSFLPLL